MTPHSQQHHSNEKKPVVKILMKTASPNYNWLKVTSDLRSSYSKIQVEEKGASQSNEWKESWPLSQNISPVRWKFTGEIYDLVIDHFFCYERRKGHTLQILCMCVCDFTSVRPAAVIVCLTALLMWLYSKVGFSSLCYITGRLTEGVWHCMLSTPWTGTIFRY